MKKLPFLTLLISLLDPTIAMGADYYYCDCQAGAAHECVTGNDSHRGTDPAQPRRSFSHAQSLFARLKAGDSIRICRGGSFLASTATQWVNTRCRGSKPCTITDYPPPSQSSQLPRPIITQPNNATLFGLDNGGNADHEEGYIFSNLDLRCTGCLSEGRGWAFFLYNDVDDITLENISIDGFRIGVHLGGSNTPNRGSDGTLDRVTLKKLNIVNSKAQGILGGANGLVIEDSYFENNGGGTYYDHNIYISKGRNIIVRRNELYRATLDKNGKCHGPSLVVHGVIDDLLIEGNTVREDVGKSTPYCWGIAVDPGYHSAESFTNVVIRGNKVINVGNIGIALAACRDCVIENNIILHQQAYGIIAIDASDKLKGPEDATLNNVFIRNNSIFIATAGNSTGIRLGVEGTQHALVSNAIHYTGSGIFYCLNASLSPSAYRSIDNNICYFPNAASRSEWERGSGVKPNPLSAWQALSGLDSNSHYIDPGFRNPTLLDFSPKTKTAGVVGKGHKTLSTAKDTVGKKRDNQPDTGAIEFGL